MLKVSITIKIYFILTYFGFSVRLWAERVEIVFLYLIYLFLKSGLTDQICLCQLQLPHPQRDFISVRHTTCVTSELPYVAKENLSFFFKNLPKWNFQGPMLMMQLQAKTATLPMIPDLTPGKKRKRCQSCPKKKDTKTSTICLKCQKYICKAHCQTFTYCLTCIWTQWEQWFCLYSTFKKKKPHKCFTIVTTNTIS